MAEFLVTLFFGWLGIHKFLKKKYVLGILYLCTMGGFGIVWIFDVISAYIKMIKGKKHTSEIRNPDMLSDFGHEGSGKQFIKSFDTVIVGTFAKCALDSDSEREDLIFCVKPNWELFLKYWEYKGNPAYYVLHPNGVDLGNIRAGLAKILYDEYSDCEFKVYAVSKGFDSAHDCATYNIRIDIYR